MKARDALSECPNCGAAEICLLGDIHPSVELTSAEFDTVFDFAQKLSPSQFYRCKHCELSFRSPQPCDEDLNDFYRRLSALNWDYDPNSVGSWTVARKLLMNHFAAEVPLRVADVGAFRGGFLMTLPAAWQKFAVEPNQDVLPQMQQIGIVHIGDFIDDRNLEAYHESFDVVTLFDVFEHLLHPDEAIKRLIGLLKPGGMVLISTGNAAHWTWKALNTHHWYLHTMQHVCVGSREYFKRFCLRNGLRLECVCRHCHKRSSLKTRFLQSIETLHWWSRQSTGARYLVSAFLQKLPGMQYLIHRTAAPFATGIADHTLVVIRKPIQ